MNIFLDLADNLLFNLLVFYLIVYLLILSSTSLVLGSVVSSLEKQPSSNYLMSLLPLFRVQWLWFLLIVNMAGLPPAIFFGPKLGLLSTIFSSGTLAVFLALSSSIMLGWTTYSSLGQQVLNTWGLVSTGVIKNRVLHPTMSYVLTIIAIFFLTGFLFLDDLYLIVSWMSF